jgi:hypothetical protein
LRQPVIRHAGVSATGDYAATGTMTPMLKSESKGQL